MQLFGGGKGRERQELLRIFHALGQNPFQAHGFLTIGVTRERENFTAENAKNTEQRRRKQIINRGFRG